MFSRTDDTPEPTPAEQRLARLDESMLKEMVRSRYGDEMMDRMTMITVDSSGLFMMATFSHSSETFDERSYIPSRVFPLSVIHSFQYINFEGERPSLHQTNIAVVQSPFADVRYDDVPLSEILMPTIKREPRSIRQSIDEPQKVGGAHDDTFVTADEAWWIGQQLTAAGELLISWNRFITEWWAGDERQICIDLAAQWGTAVASGEAQSQYAHRVTQLRKMGIEPKLGDLIVRSNDMGIAGGVDGIYVERVGDGVIEQVEVEQKFSVLVGVLVKLGASVEHVAKAHDMLADEFGSDTTIHLCYADMHGLLMDGAIKRTQQAADRASAE